jgi:hypothetical protein
MNNVSSIPLRDASNPLTGTNKNVGPRENYGKKLEKFFIRE